MSPDEEPQSLPPSCDELLNQALSPENSFKDELEAAKNMADEFKDKYFRCLAESENLRKRLQKEKQELIQYAIQNVMLDFLPPIDHFENALRFIEQASPEVKHWAVGFEMILGQLKDALSNNGVTPIDALGQMFDHDAHEAIEMVHSTTHLPGIIVEVSMKGYKIGDKILRPARVKVAKGTTDDAVASEESNHLNQQNQ